MGSAESGQRGHLDLFTEFPSLVFGHCFVANQETLVTESFETPWSESFLEIQLLVKND